MRGFKKKQEGYLTVYLTLSMAIMLSLLLTLVEGARRNGMKLETECAMDVAMNSVLAEYNRELFDKYRLFAIDCSYGTDQVMLENTSSRLLYYLNKNLVSSHSNDYFGQWIYKDLFALYPEAVTLQNVLLITDHDGEMFRRQGIQIVKEDLGIAYVAQMAEWLKTVEEYEMNSRDIYSEKQELESQLMEYDGMEIDLTENGQTIGYEILKIINPTGKLEELRKKSLLSIVTDSSVGLSECKLPKRQLVYERSKAKDILKGNLKIPDQSLIEELAQKVFFDEYLLKYMGHYGKAKEQSCLQYQIEYLLVGLDTDIDNLSVVLSALLALREVANTVYLFSDQEKYEAVQTLVLAITTVLMVPELEKLFTPIVIMGWAFAESLYDVSLLLSGDRVPLLKDAESWHLGLANALDADFIKPGKENSQGVQNKGLSYEDYLRIFLCMVDKNILTGRAMNMVEADISGTPGNANFRLDGCIVGLEAAVTVKSKYGPHFEIKRKRYY